MKEDGKIKLILARDTISEKDNIDKDRCDFSLTDRSMTERPLLYVTTKRNEKEFAELPGWTTLMNNGTDRIKRFTVRLSTKTLHAQLAALFSNQEVIWIE